MDKCGTTSMKAPPYGGQSGKAAASIAGMCLKGAAGFGGK
jgi:hypothetical protein